MAQDLLTALLRDVSRSFYLTLRILPKPVRRPIGLGYLLARATDTIADTTLVPIHARLQALEDLRASILGSRPSPPDLHAFLAAAPAPGVTAPPQAGAPSDSERELLSRIHEALDVLHTLPPDDRERIRAVLSTITSGQLLDLNRFESSGAGTAIKALASIAELDDYTYRVAGCVGEFWTLTCHAHLPLPGISGQPAREPGPLQLTDGIRFGKGLQLVNILRDIPADLRRGRCYLPSELLRRPKLTPEALLDAGHWPRLQPEYETLVDTARRHLHAGWQYTCRLPRTQRRLRLACAWPLLIGSQTLALLQRSNPLDASTRLRIRRTDVRLLIARSVVLLPFPTAWERQFNRH